MSPTNALETVYTIVKRDKIPVLMEFTLVGKIKFNM